MGTEEQNNQENVQELSTIDMIEKVRGTEEFNTLVTNHSKQYIGGELKTVYSSFDKVVKDNLGLDKPDDIKSTDWVNKHLSRIPELENELKALKAQSDGGKEQEKLWNSKFKKLNDQLSAKDEEIKNIVQKGFKNNVSNQLDTFLVGKNFKPSYSEDDVTTLVEAKKAKIINNTRKLENGKVAVWNSLKDEYYTDTLGEPLTPVQVAELEFKTMFHVKTPGGNTPPDGEQASIKGDVLTIDMANVKTRGDFYDLFNKTIAPKGLPSHSKEFQNIQKATMAHYKVANLPLS